MKIFCAYILTTISAFAFSQNIVREQYDKLFPNNKSIQIAKLNNRIDSLQKINSGLKSSLDVAEYKIDTLYEQVGHLEKELISEKSKQSHSQNVLSKENERLKDSILALSFPLVICKEEAILKKGVKDPTLRNTCNWRSYQIIEMGLPDYQSRYTWKSEISETKDGDTVQIQNHDLFKSEKIGELEKMINDRLSEDLKSIREMSPDCFSRRKQYTGFKLKDMRIAINDDSEISFEVQYGLTDRCFAVNTLSTSFKIAEMKEFFK